MESVTIKLERYEDMKAEIEALEEENERFMSCFKSTRLIDGSIAIEINQDYLIRFLGDKFFHELQPTPSEIISNMFETMLSKVDPMVLVKKQ